MIKKIVFTAGMALLLITSCTPEDKNQQGDDTTHEDNIVLSSATTLGAEHISAISAVLQGSASLSSSGVSNLKVGFQYSTSSSTLISNPITVETTSVDENNSFSIVITDLTPATQYFYRSYASLNNQNVYGEAKEFATKDLGTLLETLEASDIDATSVTLNAKIDLTDIKYSDIYYGFEFRNIENDSFFDLEGGSIIDNSYNVSLTVLSPETQYRYKAYLQLDQNSFYGEEKSFYTKSFKFAAIDLGLSVKWGNANLGANSPEEYGDYYAWGETEPSNLYDWSNYKWYDDYYNEITKYGTNSHYGIIDNKTVLEAEDDAANVKLGGQWRMPTVAEWEELMQKCKIGYSSLNTGGFLVIGPNNAEIFLPYAGYKDGIYNRDSGGSCNYWSSSLCTEGPISAWYFYLNSTGLGLEDGLRYTGRSIRPVTE